jgi:hypothetical protein
VNSARFVFRLLNVMSLLFVSLAIAGFALQGHAAWFAIVAGAFWGLVPAGLLFGLTEMATPGWVIHLREQAVAGQNVRQQRVGAWFSRRLAISGSRPWESPTARFRVRVLGLALTASWVVAGAVALWLSTHTDKLTG